MPPREADAPASVGFGSVTGVLLEVRCAHIVSDASVRRVAPRGRVAGPADAGGRMRSCDSTTSRTPACAAELADVVQRIGADLGAAFVDGGRHPRFGTRNFVLPLARGAYVEVVAALDHPAADKVPFGRAVRRRAEDGGGWLGWVLAVDDLAPVEARLGRSAVPGHRVRPDGYDLRWRQIGVLDLLDDPQLPFFLKWEVPPSAAPVRGGRPAGHRAGGAVRRPRRRCAPGSGSRWTVPLDDVAVDWVDAEDPGLVAVHFTTAHGRVRVD